MPQRYQRLVIVGVGLIGGSIGLAAKKRNLVDRVVGLVRSDASGQRALQCGAVDEVTTETVTAMEGADIAVVCTPVGSIVENLIKIICVSEDDTLITDGGSTKADIVFQGDTEADVWGGKRFIGSHPLAGDHRSGPEAARDDLFVDKLVVVTPSENTAEITTHAVEQFWQDLGARPTRMTPAAHDAALAQTSHLPHLLAAALAATTPEAALELVGSGWRDTTRVASGDALLWRDIFMDNRTNVLASLDELEAQLAAFRQALTNADSSALEHLLEKGKTRRDAVGS